MNTLTRPQTGIIEWPGSEPIETTREHAVNTLRACAFLREPVRVFANGKWTDTRGISYPSGITEEQAVIVQELLLHRIFSKLMSFLPQGTPARLVGPKEAPWDDGWMIEVDREWTIGATVELNRGYRGVIRWHAYDPAGEPLAEGATEVAAAAALIGAYIQNRVTTDWNNR